MKHYILRNGVIHSKYDTANEAFVRLQTLQPMSYGELAEWQSIFSNLADRFDLQEEFKENGII